MSLFNPGNSYSRKHQWVCKMPTRTGRRTVTLTLKSRYSSVINYQSVNVLTRTKTKLSVVVFTSNWSISLWSTVQHVWKFESTESSAAADFCPIWFTVDLSFKHNKNQTFDFLCQTANVCPSAHEQRMHGFGPSATPCTMGRADCLCYLGHLAKAIVCVQLGVQDIHAFCTHRHLYT